MTNVYEQLSQIVHEAIYFDETDRVIALEGKIKALLSDGVLANKKPELYKLLNTLLVQIGWSKLPLAKFDEAVNLFTHHFDEMLGLEDFNLVGKFRLCLLGLPEFEDRDELKQEIKSVLNKNQTVITSGKMSDGQPPTIENWLKIYVSYVGTEPADALKLQQFYLSDKNFNGLPSEEKERLKKFFAFYERLKLSSFTPEGIEDSVPVNTPEFKGYIKNGELIKVGEKLDPRLEKIYSSSIETIEGGKKLGRASGVTEAPISVTNNPNQSRLEELKKIAETFPAGSLERRAIEQEIANLNK